MSDDEDSAGAHVPRRPQFTLEELFGGNYISPARSKPLLNVNKRGFLNVVLHTESHNKIVEEQVCALSSLS